MKFAFNSPSSSELPREIGAFPADIQTTGGLSHHLTPSSTRNPLFPTSAPVQRWLQSPCVIKKILTVTLILLAFLQPLVSAADPGATLPGRVVAVWSKGAGKFVRSAGVDNGALRADRDSYEANDEGRFLCFAEADGTFAFMDVMLERYLTHAAGQLTSAVTAAASTRRFTLVDRGNNYYALKADSGKYVRVDGAGNLVVDTDTVTDDAVFAIVPIRTGPNVVMRAYGGDEADIFSSNPADFPVNKVNIGMLQMTPSLYTDLQFTKMRAVWNTNRYETEFILPYTQSPSVTLASQVDALVNRIKRLEGLGYTFDYVILYHEILANLPGGPWSDPRVSSQEEVNLFRTKVTAAYNSGKVKHPSYKVFTMPYQFTDGSLMGIPPYADTPVGCDAETLEFIKNNFDGMFLEVNGHDYSSRNEDSDAAAAAVWCRDNGLEFGITSGGSDNKDINYKAMYGNIFTKMANAGFDKSWDKMHYVLHHVFQPYANRLPEWVANTTTENARWLIENVMPEEAPSISPTLDTDEDGIPDLQEARNRTFPLEASPLVFDDFSTYSDGSIRGQAGSPLGFSGTWGANTTTTPTVAGGVLRAGATTPQRSRRTIASAPLVSATTVYIRTNVALPRVGFVALEFAPTANSDANTIPLVGGANLSVSPSGSGGSGSGTIMANDGLNHEWLLKLDLTTLAGEVWIDGNTAAFDPSSGGSGFTAPTSFRFGAINVATFSTTPGTLSLDDIRIGESWGSIGVTLSPEIFTGYITNPAFGLNPSQQGFALDPDGDRIPNGLEAWFGTHPGEVSVGLTNLATHGTTSTFTHPQNMSVPTDMSCLYQWSPNLTDWYAGDGVDGPDGGPIVNISPTTVGSVTTVTVAATGELEQFFMRIEVKQN